ncbi:MAG TPA: sigma-54 dependent transcriptional regulator [Puia sp.]
MKKRILIVEDEAIIAADLRVVLEMAGYEVCGIASSVNRALEMVEQFRPCLVLIDIFLKGELSGIDLAHCLNKKDIPFVYLSANCNQQVLEAAKVTHPYGFMVKPFREPDLLVMLSIAAYRHEHYRQLKAEGTRKTLTLPPGRVSGIIGKSAPMMKVFEKVGQVALLDTTVLILGESGTGKEGIATLIHEGSPRRDKAFVKINCAALPANLVESELFGHEKGAFTGASGTKIGKFEKANGGTIFLDEIGDMSAELQAKLLRVLQEREIERVGGNEPIRVDVRVIAATNCNLERAVAEGDFRLDLYYRLNVFPIVVPPLRSRKEDIPLLADHFVGFFSGKAGKRIKSIAPGVVRELAAYSWPGNVRELQNLIERSVLMTGGEVLERVEFMPLFRERAVVMGAPRVKTIEELEREHIEAVLEQCGNRVAGPGGAAEFLNLPPSTLASKIKRLGIVKK